MIHSALHPGWARLVTLAIGLTILCVGCAQVPRQYVDMAEPGVTLTSLNAQPEMYRGKVLLLGGTIVEEEEKEQYLWLRVKNRPLDQDDVPHRPLDTSGPEAGHYWVKLPSCDTSIFGWWVPPRAQGCRASQLQNNAVANSSNFLRCDYGLVASHRRVAHHPHNKVPRIIRYATLK